jgi:hypothetical protein
MLDSDGDGFVTASDLVRSAQQLCTLGGPALVAKERADIGDALVALAASMGVEPSWREKVRRRPGQSAWGAARKGLPAACAAGSGLALLGARCAAPYLMPNLPTPLSPRRAPCLPTSSMAATRSWARRGW